MESGGNRTVKAKAARICLAGIAILICSVLAVRAARHGLARYTYEAKTGSPEIEDLNRAIQLNPDDPEPHLLMAEALADANQNEQAIKHCERAIMLRPGDHFSWLELGYLRKISGDLPGACQAFSQAVALAPYYGQSHWKFGKCLLSMGKRDEAFAELRTAAHRQPAYLEGFLELVWKNTDGTAKAIGNAVRPQDAASNIAVGRFLLGKWRWRDALVFYNQAGTDSASDRQELINRFVLAKRFPQAYQIWQLDHASESNSCIDERGCIFDSSFEATRKFEEAGFGWQVANNRSIIAEIDEGVASSGKKSLRIQFQGEAELSGSLLSQFVLVLPSTKYRLTFKAKTNDILSGGLLLFSVVDTLGNKVDVSSDLPSGTQDWQIFSMEFTTSDQTDAVVLGLGRAPCGWSRCPIFGTLWLDEFTLRKL
jgi:tetratricopeptide (TPR) repeat protein